MGPSLVWFPNRSKIWALLGLSAFLWPLCPWPVRRPFSTRPLLLPSALSPPAPFLPPSAVSSREISASDFEKKRWRIPFLSLFSLFGPSLRLLPAKTRHTRVSLFLDQNFKPVGACSAYSIATSFFFPGHL